MYMILPPALAQAKPKKTSQPVLQKGNLIEKKAK